MGTVAAKIQMATSKSPNRLPWKNIFEAYGAGDQCCGLLDLCARLESLPQLLTEFLGRLRNVDPKMHPLSVAHFLKEREDD